MAEYDPLRECSDEELLRRFRRGQRDLFGTLVRRYERELFGYLRRYVGDAHLADDVFQNTFLQVYVKSEQFEDGRPFRPWLYTIATHQAIDALRRAGRQQTASLDQAIGMDGDGELRSLLDLLEARAPGPDEQAMDEDRKIHVRACVDGLPEFLKQVVILAYYQGLKYREIADILEIPVGTVKSRLHTALLKLQEAGAATPSLPDL